MSASDSVNCPSREELGAYSVGRVSEATLEKIASHLETCSECLATLSTISDEDDSLLGGLRKSSGGEQFLDEPECRQAVLQFEAIGCDASLQTRSHETPIPDLPKKLGRYELLEELGQGGMGTVYLARDTQLDREVALKIPHFRSNENPRFLQRFYREARAAATIEHPNLCPVHDVGEIDGFPYLSMARIRGESLSKLLKARGPVSEREAAEIVQKVAMAVDEAHARAVVHRDIKPSNIMITEEGEPILTDFGLAQRLELRDTRLTHSGFIVGTPSYMAPEQVDGDPDTVGPRCDVYSLGVVLYEMLTGTLPFRGSLLSVLSQLGKDQPVPPSAHRPGVDRQLEKICLKALAKSPEDRYQSAAQMAEALDQYLQGPPQAAGPPSRRHWLIWGSVAGAAALLLTFAAVLTIVTNRGTLEIKTFDEDVKVSVLKNGQEVQIIDTKTDKKITLRAGQYELKLSDGKPGLWLSTKQFTLRRGGRVIVEVRARGQPEPVGSEQPTSATEPLAVAGRDRAQYEKGTALGKLLLTIPNPTPAAGDSFGIRLASVGNNILVGAHQDDTGVTNAGAAYLLDGSTGKLLRAFQKPTPATNDYLGLPVAAMGDNVLVGAHYDDTNGKDAGAAYLFNGSNADLTLAIPNPTPNAGDFFGYSVAAVGNNILVGAHSDDTDGSDAGIAYLFDGLTGKLLRTIHNPKPDAGDHFGRDLAALGNNFIICAYLDDTDATDTGIVYLFDGSSGQLLRTFHNPAPNTGDGFGHSVAAVGTNVLVGALYDDTDGGDTGIAYLFDGSTGQRLLTFRNPTPDAGDRFGLSVAAVGPNVLIGAPFDHSGANAGGAAYLFDGSTGQLLLTFHNPTPNAGDEFGWSIAAVGSKILIGADADDTGASDAGVAYLFEGVISSTTTRSHPSPPSGAMPVKATGYGRKRL